MKVISSQAESAGALINRRATVQTKVVVPSFSTSSALFAQHFSILRELRKRVDAMKNALEDQQDQEASWRALEKIMSMLESACNFLNYTIQK